MNRREKLQELLQDTPDDQFLRYALASELGKGEAVDKEKCLDLYRGLMSDNHAYVPAFLMSAQLLQQMGRLDEAAGVLRTGIEAARLQDDLHAASEMSELLAQL